MRPQNKYALYTGSLRFINKLGVSFLLGVCYNMWKLDKYAQRKTRFETIRNFISDNGGNIMKLFRKKQQPPRQEWKPHWSVRFVKWILASAFGAVKIAIGALATVAMIIGICVVVLAGSLGDYMESEILSNLEADRGESDVNLNSYVFYLDENGDIQKLQNIFAENNREWADFEDIPQDLIHATIAIEDKRFYEHQGVDWVTTVKACFFMFFGNGDRGGSTITQQLVKNVTENWDVTVQRKVQEIFTAIEYERRYSKNEILEWYLNEIYMGNRINGVKMAAAKYFGKELKALTVAECASLISITNNPSLYNPYRTNLDAGGMTGAERNKERQKDTLAEMYKQGWIDQETYFEAYSQPLVFKDGIADEDRWIKCVNETCDYEGIVASLVGEEGSDKKKCPACGTEIPVTEDASLSVYSYYVDTLLEDVAEDLAKRDGVEWNSSTMAFYKKKIASSGYNIFACLDMRVQNAVDSIYQNLDEIPKVRSGQQPQSAMVVIDNRTGDIVAMAGGVGKDKVHDGQNRAVDSKLQTGSSIKPLSVYGPGFESGAISPATVVRDLPQKYPDGRDGWPKNDNRRYSYSRTIYSAIERSVNACAVSTLELIGTGYAYSFAKETLMMRSLLDSYTASSGTEMSDADFAPLALGAQTLGLTVREMASAFASFPNNGYWREGRTYTKVYDHKGNLVLDNTQDTHQAFSEKTVNYMHYCLNGSVGGTGGNARISGQNVYGKTGTTASNKDRWFCGYTSYYTAAVWFGFDTPEVINLVNSGTNPAAILFSKVLTKLHTGLPKVQLIDYSKMGSVTMCLDSGKVATEACTADVRSPEVDRTDSALVYPEDRPKEKCDKHVLVDYCTEGKGVATEYCQLFAAAYAQQEGYDATKPLLERKSLVKMTQQEVNELYRAKDSGLLPEYLLNNYVWLVTQNGQDGVWKGFDGTLQQAVDAPYLICPLHTEASWLAYQESLVPEETQPEETVPGETVPGEDDGAVG